MAQKLASELFVGRERELAFLQQRVDGALQGKGGLVFLTWSSSFGLLFISLLSPSWIDIEVASSSNGAATCAQGPAALKAGRWDGV